MVDIEIVDKLGDEKKETPNYRAMIKEGDCYWVSLDSGKLQLRMIVAGGKIIALNEPRLRGSTWSELWDSGIYSNHRIRPAKVKIVAEKPNFD